MNAAVETETQPSIPPLIAQLLQKLELPYETCQDTPELAPASRVEPLMSNVERPLSFAVTGCSWPNSALW